MTNEEIAARLEEVADLLELQPGANRYRIAAYRQAAETLRSLPEPVEAILARSPAGGRRRALERLYGIGRALAGSIEELVETGHLGLLDRLREEADPERTFATLPGVGPVLARRIHEQLGVETLPELEEAARQGRLREVPGIGPTLEQQIREVLQARLQRRARRLPELPEARPPVAELLDVDREYREKAARLPRIAPRRFNPTGEAWLPVLRTRRGPRRYTALYSNTLLAHQLGRTRDWVVLYYALPGETEHSATVVTATHGPLEGRRVVRGREEECLRYYAQQAPEGSSRAARRSA